MAATPDPTSPPAINLEEANVGADDDENVLDATMGGDQANQTGLDEIEDETGAANDLDDDTATKEGHAPEEGDLSGADADDAGNAGEESAESNRNGSDDEDDDMPPPPPPSFTYFPSPPHHPTTSPQTSFPTLILPPSPLSTHTSPIPPSLTPATIHQFTPISHPIFDTPIPNTTPTAESPIRDNQAIPKPLPQPTSFPTSISPFPITFTRKRRRDQRRALSPINEEPSNDNRVPSPVPSSHSNNHHTPSPVSSPCSALPHSNFLIEYNPLPPSSHPPPPPSPPPPPPSQDEFNAWREGLRASFDFIFHNYHQLSTDELLEWELAHPLDIPPILSYIPEPNELPFFHHFLRPSLMGLLFQFGEYIRIELAKRAA